MSTSDLQNLTQKTLGGMDRRAVMRLCGQAAALAGLGTATVGCATMGSQVVLEDVDADKLVARSSKLARGMLGLLTEPANNAESMPRIDEIIQGTGIGPATVHGPATEFDYVGHNLTVKADQGYMSVSVYADAAFVTPMLVRKGVLVAGGPDGARSACSTTVGKCTNNTEGKHVFSDTGGDDPCPQDGFMDPGSLDLDPLTAFSDPALRFFDTVVVRASRALRGGGSDRDPAKIAAMIDRAKDVDGVKEAFFATADRGDVIWYDFMVVFDNGGAAVVQSAVGAAEPVFSTEPTKDIAVLFDGAQVDSIPEPTGDPDVQMGLVRIWS